MGKRVNGMMSIKLKTRRKYFNFANLESIFMNNMKKLLYSIINLTPCLGKQDHHLLPFHRKEALIEWLEVTLLNVYEVIAPFDTPSTFTSATL
jgi:hypothetical protein